MAVIHVHYRQPGEVLIYKDDQGELHFADHEGYCRPHSHFLPHVPKFHFAHVAACEGFEHPGKTCDDVAYDQAEAE